MGKLIVYMSSPLRGDIGMNVGYALRICGELIKVGLCPVCSHLVGYGVYGEVSEAEAMGVAYRMIEVSDILYNPLPIRTEGMRLEVEYAKSLGKPIYEGISVEELANRLGV